MSAHDIWLIQRIKTKQRVVTNRDLEQPFSPSIDFHFEMDYMGSSEFEWGALPQALKRMRAATMIDAPKRIKIAGKYVCWFVGPEDEYNIAKALFIDQLGVSDKPISRLKEISYIRHNFVEDEPKASLNGKPLPTNFAKSLGSYNWYDGWWAVDKTFVLLKTKADAETWLRCVKAKKP